MKVIVYDLSFPGTANINKSDWEILQYYVNHFNKESNIKMINNKNIKIVLTVSKHLFIIMSSINYKSLDIFIIQKMETIPSQIMV